jgi:signal transduction histidine kinase
MIQMQRLWANSRRLPVFIICLALAVLAGAVLLTSLQVRKKIRDQIAGRDGEVLYGVALLELEEESRDVSPSDPAGQLTVLLKTSQLKGVMAARLFDNVGRFIQAFPPEVVEIPVLGTDLQSLKHLQPVTHFNPATRLSDLFINADPKSVGLDRDTVPVLEVNVPLHARSSKELAGVAQFLIEGQSIAREFARLDRHLFLQGLATFIAGGALLSIAIGVAFQRLQRAHRLLAERTDHLAQANQELALAAKTSALGAVTAHLIHGLKNPLAGLHSFVLGRPATLTEAEAADWQQAAASTRRMQTMVSEVISLLRDEESGARYEVTLTELGEIVTSRVFQQARDSRVEFSLKLAGDAVLQNRTANLVALMLVNLVQNALEATPPGRSVLLAANQSRDRILFEVRDQGLGFSGSATPFAPCRSLKEGGSGIGLALCKQLANHLGADLQLRSSTPAGCVFSLELPLTRPDGDPRAKSAVHST